MIDVESFADDVMDRPITNRPQLFEAFCHRKLRVFPAIQIAKPKEQAAENDGRCSGGNDRHAKHNSWPWRLMSLKFIMFPNPEKPKENGAGVERRHPIFEQSFFLITQRLSWQSFRHAGSGASFMPASESFSLLNENAKPEELAQFADKIPCGFYVQAYSARAWSLQRSRSQFVTLKRGQNIRYLPYAFTEHGC